MLFLGEVEGWGEVVALFLCFVCANSLKEKDYVPDVCAAEMGSSA